MDDMAKINEEFDRLINSSLWWQEVIKECTRRHCVAQAGIPSKHKVIAAQMILEVISITDAQLTKARISPAFIEAKNIIGSLNVGDEFPKRLSEIFEERKTSAIAELDQMLLTLMSLITDETCKANFETVLAEGKAIKLSVAGIIEKYRIKDLLQKRIIRAIFELVEEKNRIGGLNSPFSFKSYSPGEIGRGENDAIVDRDDLLAYRVFDPLWRIERIVYEPMYLSFPLKWSSEISVLTIRNLYEEHKAGKDVLFGLVNNYKNGEALEGLMDSILYCPVVCHHYQLFEEAVKAFKQELYRVCSVTLLSLIEGLIWSFAWWWNERKGPIFDRSLSQESYKNTKFELETKNFKKITKPTVGDLLRNTIFGDEIYDEFVEFYCEELFSERNPVLHGKEPKYGTSKKAATLLYVTQIVMSHITKAFIDDLYNNHFALIEEQKSV